MMLVIDMQRDEKFFNHGPDFSGGTDFSASDQADEWLSYLYSGHASAEGQQNFSRWLKASEENSEAYHRSETLWRDLGMADNLEELVNIKSGDKSSGGKRQTTLSVYHKFAAIAAVLIVVLASSFWWQDYKPDESNILYASAVGEIKTITLADGSRVTLGADSSISSQFNNKKRHVQLVQGRAFFDVRRNEEKSFTVQSGGMMVKVLGTAFDVARSPSGISVSVSHGTVKVQETAGLEGREAKLTIGQQIKTDVAGRLGTIQAYDPEVSLSWRRGRLSYVGARLEDVVADVNRYRKKKIILEGDQLKGILVTMAFRNDQTDHLLSSLKQTKPIIIKNSETHVLVKFSH